MPVVDHTRNSVTTKLASDTVKTAATAISPYPEGAEERAASSRYVNRHGVLTLIGIEFGSRSWTSRGQPERVIEFTTTRGD